MPTTDLVQDVPQAPAAMTAATSTDDTSRRNRYREYAEFWNGIQWQSRPVKQSETRLVLNYARLVLRKAVSYTLGEPAKQSIIPDELSDEAAQEIESRYAAELDRAGADDLDPQLIADASIYGESACKITWSPIYNRLTFAAVHPNQINVFTDPADPINPVRVQHGYHLPGWSVPAHFGLPADVANGSTDRELYPVIEDWTTETWSVTVNGEELFSQTNPYGIVPFALLINEPRTGHQWGISDLADLIDVCRELNKRVSTVADVLNLSGAPIAVLENVAESSGINAKPGATWELPEGAKAYLLDLLSGGGVDLHIKQIDELRSALHDLSETPKTAFGDSGRALSGAALEVELQPLVQKVRRKRAALARFYRRRNLIALSLLQQFAGLDIDAARIRTAPIFPPILPTDSEAQANTAAVLVNAGIRSRQTAAAELGSADAAAEFSQWITENAAITAATPQPAQDAGMSDQSSGRQNATTHEGAQN